ncbi:hypothetical protein KR018_002578 [Drosophila ironensis]|nr:hypothetical protein KR018_002578 [Drosophila ironensis]
MKHLQGSYLIVCLCLIGIRVLGHEQEENQDHNGPSNVQSRVIGGKSISNAKLGGYIVALKYAEVFYCGGTLIHNLIVLTAAHCFLGREKVLLWQVHGGISRLTEKGIRRRVMKFILSKEFKESTMEMDVALMRLDKPMKGKLISTLALCSVDVPVGILVQVSGWGKVNANHEGPVNQLRTVRVPIIDKKKCYLSYQPVCKSKITESMLCAGVLGEKDACTMDSGGPLVYQKRVCGIVSFGIGCASNKFPGVYTSVMSVKSFITKGKCQLLGNRG